jgi:hypothetical protein
MLIAILVVIATDSGCYEPVFPRPPDWVEVLIIAKQTAFI